MPQYLCRHVLMSTKRIRSKISINKTMTLYFVLKLKSTIKAKISVLVFCCLPQSLWYQNHGFWYTFSSISEYISACYTQIFSWLTNSYGRRNSSPSSQVSLGFLIVLLLDHHPQSLYDMVMRFQSTQTRSFSNGWGRINWSWCGCSVISQKNLCALFRSFTLLMRSGPVLEISTIVFQPQEN